jgi:ribosomal protein S18 acetylase RimI-like enzyme
MNISYHALNTDNYEKMIEVWSASGLPIRPTGRDSYDKIKAEMQKNPEFFIGAFDDDRLIGLVIASSDNRKGWINHLAVIPEYRGLGIARELIRKAEDVLSRTGIEILACLVMDDNTSSIRLFESAGYSHWPNVLYFRKTLRDDI